MPAQSWTERGLDREFLQDHVKKYGEIHKTCKKGAPSKEKRLFLDNLLKAYDEKFPERIDKMVLPNIGKGGTPIERRKVMSKVSIYAIRCHIHSLQYQRIEEYLKNIYERQAPAGIVTPKEAPILPLASTKGSRTESTLKAYIREKGEQFEMDIEAEHKAYVQQCGSEGTIPIPKPGWCNQYVSRKFKAEKEEYQAAIKASRQEGHVSTPAANLSALVDTENPLSESDRRQYARTVQG
jgi:hypothetical protein